MLLWQPTHLLYVQYTHTISERERKREREERERGAKRRKLDKAPFAVRRSLLKKK